MINDEDYHPKARATEVLLSPVVQITSNDTRKITPSIVELMKISDLSSIGNGQRPTIVVLFSSVSPPDWNELEVGCNVYKPHIDNDRILFEASKCGYYAVLVRFSLPSATVVVDPNKDNELKILDLPGFKLEVPPKTLKFCLEIQAIVHFDGPMLNIEGDNSPLASPCIEVRPHGQKFTEEITIMIPIPKYTEIATKYPEAKLQVWHSPSDPSKYTKLDWNLHDKDTERSMAEGQNVALVHISHSGVIMCKWKVNNIDTLDKDAVHNYYKKKADSVMGRCTVLMSEVLPDNSIDKFLISAYVYPFCEEGYRNPEYPCSLHDSGNLPVNVKVGNLFF